MSDMGDSDWRTEADDQWLAEHRSTFFKRRRAGMLAGLDLGSVLPSVGGAPRNPQLKVGGKEYSVVRYAENYAAYITTEITRAWCRSCGGSLEIHRIHRTDKNNVRRSYGSVQACPTCHPRHWLFVTHSSRVRAAQRLREKNVL